MDGKQKLFAFKLAEKNQKTGDSGKWKAREGVTAGGCTDVRPPYLVYAYSDWFWPGDDNGPYC